MAATDLAAADRGVLAGSVLADLGDVVFQTDRQGCWTYLNPAWQALTGTTVEGALGKRCLDCVHPADRHVPRQLFKSLRGNRHEGARHRIRLLHQDGSVRWVELCARLIADRGGRIGGAYGNLRDITERKASEEKLRFAASVFAHASEGIVITDASGCIVDANRAFEQITGYSREEAVGCNPSMLSSGRQGEEFYRAMWGEVTSTGYWQGEVWNRRKSGELYVERLTIVAVHDEYNVQKYFVGMFSDITTQTMQAQHLEHIAHYDALTGLPNRRLLAARLQQSMAQARRYQTRVAVAYLDIDRFKVVNETHGHEFGDELLVMIGKRLRQAVRECDTVCRLGGDEFVAVLDHIQSIEECMPMVERILDVVAMPLTLRGVALNVTCSLGLSLYPQAEEIDPDQLIRQADQAMYSAKTGGKARCVLFDDLAEVQPHDPAHDAVSVELGRALREGEFELHYQPIVELRTGRVNSAEALIRWRHPERGLLSPAAFLHLLQGRPIAMLIEDWVLQDAIAQHQRWLDQGLDLAVSINMSGEQLQQPDFVANLRKKLAAHPRVDASRIKLEVLETSALEDISRVSNTIVECSKMGVAFALDDFGTGYSSLLYLKQLPAKRIKIDQSFVRDMLTDPDDLAILEGVIGMAEAFKRDTIAEGVESFAHARMLIQLGCKMAQGFGIARPMPAQDMPAWVAGWKMPAELLQCVPIDRSGLQLLAAGVENRAWAASLGAYARSAAGELPTLSDRACRVALWLDDPVNCSMADPAIVDAARAVHAELHRAAHVVTDAGAASGHAADLAGAGLEQLGERLLLAISDLLDSRSAGLLARGRA